MESATLQQSIKPAFNLLKLTFRIVPIVAGLTLIALTLLASGNYLDVAVRDLVMAIGAFSLARLAKVVLVEKNVHVKTVFA